MPGKIVRHTKSVVIVLLGLLIGLHEVIPHHHHYSTICKDEGYAGVPQEQHHERHFPLETDNHCHTLNELINDSKSGNPVSRITPELSGFTCIYFETGFYSGAIRQVSRKPVVHVPDRLCLMSDSPLRAPPLSV